MSSMENPRSPAAKGRIETRDVRDPLVILKDMLAGILIEEALFQQESTPPTAEELKAFRDIKISKMVRELGLQYDAVTLGPILRIMRGIEDDLKKTKISPI